MTTNNIGYAITPGNFYEDFVAMVTALDTPEHKAPVTYNTDEANVQMLVQGVEDALKS